MVHSLQLRRTAAPVERPPHPLATTVPTRGTGEFLHVIGALRHGVRSYLVPLNASASLASAAGRPVSSVQPVKPLSDRERQVLALVADGHQNSSAAHALAVSPLTIKSHLDRIATKLGTRDKAGMVAFALRAGLID